MISRYKTNLFRKSFLVLCALSSPLALALDVKITGFGFVDSSPGLRRNFMAEVCGIVTGAPADKEVVVEVTMDYKSRQPGRYTTLAHRDGSFCHTGVAYTGSVQAKVRLLGDLKPNQPPLPGQSEVAVASTDESISNVGRK